MHIHQSSVPRNSEAGYSLLGVVVFMVVLGILTTAVISLKQQYDWSKRQEVTVANMSLVKEALVRYQGQNGRLPCPASLGDPMDNPNFGKEVDCTSATVAADTFRDQGRGGRYIRYGAVPVRTLGIPDSAIVDGWNHRIVYAVTEYYAGPAAGINPDVDNGAISLVDAAGTQATSVAGNIIYTVMAPGADQRGAYTLEGALIDPCTGTNCTAGDGTLQLSIFRQYNTNVAGTNNDFTATMDYSTSSESYEWRSGPWSACGCTNPKKTNIGRCEITWQGKPLIVNTVAGPRAQCKSGTKYTATESCCNTPTQTRTVTCHVKGTDAKVADNKCAAKAKPPTSQPCAQFCWSTPQFPACPSGCGKSASIKYASAASLRCNQNNTKSVVFSLCQAINKPVLAKYCPRTSPCPPPPSPTGGAYVDTNGDGIGDTHIRNLPNGTTGPSSSTLGGRVDGTSTKDSQGHYDGSHESGDEGYSSIQER